MSTNYYAVTPETPEGDEGLHIGQHVSGVEFLFQAHRDLGLTSVAAWREFLSRPGVRIVAEHGLEETLEEFMADATLRPADTADRPFRQRIRARGKTSVTFRDYEARGVPFADYDFF